VLQEPAAPLEALVRTWPPATHQISVGVRPAMSRIGIVPDGVESTSVQAPGGFAERNSLLADATKTCVAVARTAVPENPARGRAAFFQVVPSRVTITSPSTAPDFSVTAKPPLSLNMWMSVTRVVTFESCTVQLSPLSGVKRIVLLHPGCAQASWAPRPPAAQPRPPSTKLSASSGAPPGLSAIGVHVAPPSFERYTLLPPTA
jgi:hypothetical protein